MTSLLTDIRMPSRLIGRIGSGALCLLMASCSHDTDAPVSPANAGEDMADVEISIGIAPGLDYDDGTRAAPPGTSGFDHDADDQQAWQDLQEVDEVKLYVFRRDNSEADGKFMHFTDITLTPASTTDTHGHQHRTVTTRFTKVRGYSYRIVALAYDKDRISCFSNTYTGSGTLNSINNWLTVHYGDGSFEQFNASITAPTYRTWSTFTSSTTNTPNNTDSQVLDTPQLFYDALSVETANGESDIISFDDIDPEGNSRIDLPIKGVLHRGMAKVEVYMKPETLSYGLSYSMTWVALVADSPNTQTALTSYDDFMVPFNRIGTDKKGVAIAYETNLNKAEGQPLISAWLLPCQTRLGLRTRGERTAASHLFYGWLDPGVNVELHGHNGTGIVSPDVVDGVFYLRRNHKYRLTVNDPHKLLE